MFRFILATIFLACFILGSGFIALPIVISVSGFWPGIIATLFIWLFSIATGFLYLEAVLSCPKGANMMTISRNLLGPLGNWIGSTLFIYSHFGFLITYYLLAIPLLSEMLQPLLGFSIPPFMGALILSLIVGGSIFLGASFTFVFNFFVFIVLMIMVYFTVTLGSEMVSTVILNHRYWLYLFFSLPFIYNAFFYQTLVPTIAQYLNYDRKKIKAVIIFGVTLALVVILLWLWVTVGSPIGTSIVNIFQVEKSIVDAYLDLQRLPKIGKIMHLFIFFGIFHF